VEDGTPYIVMELLDGEDLETRLRRVGRLTVAAASPIAGQIAKALRTAHEAGIVHRDLKPANVFLCRHQDEETAKVLDFGIAKANGEAQVGEGTATGVVMGSVHFMSPEQTRALKHVDARTDLWALGVILYRCLTGRLPFLGDQITTVLVAISVDPVPPPSQLAPHLGPDVDRFFARALARDPAERFQSAREMSEAFGALVSGADGGTTIIPGASSPSLLGVASARSAASLGTFAPAGRTLAEPPPRRAGLVMALVIGAVLVGALGSAVAFLRLRTAALTPAMNADPIATLPPPVTTSIATSSAPVIVAPSVTATAEASVTTTVSVAAPPPSARKPVAAPAKAKSPGVWSFD
jgi:serine/threonine-protein kinase